MTRSNRIEVRNPVLPLVRKLAADLSPELRTFLAELLAALAIEARQKADDSWRRHKAPMALYWKAVSVYSGHIAKALRKGEVS